VGAAEYSDMPMNRPPEGDTYCDFFKAKHITLYLERYIDQCRFDGLSLRDRILFGFQVQAVSKLNQQWIISGDNNNKNEAKIFHASKLIVISELTSVPIMLNLCDKERFESSVIHQKNFERSAIIFSTAVQHVTVIGEEKSAADMIYASMKAKKFVS
jgi:lysine/ornithine N-monooxygenase